MQIVIIYFLVGAGGAKRAKKKEGAYCPMLLTNCVSLLGYFEETPPPPNGCLVSKKGDVRVGLSSPLGFFSFSSSILGDVSRRQVRFMRMRRRKMSPDLSDLIEVRHIHYPASVFPRRHSPLCIN